MTLRLAFMGTPDFSVPALAELIAAGHEIAAVYTQPPRPAGRGQSLRNSPVQAFAEAQNLPVRTPVNFKQAEDREAFAALDLDLAVVIAYGLILPEAILNAPRLGCINLHASLLPRWRGAAPIQRALMAGDEVTGVQVMQMEKGLDTGPIILSETVPIRPDDTAGTLHDRLAQVGAGLLPRAIAALAREGATPQPQLAAGVTYASKIDKAEARIDWTQPADVVDRQIRGLSPFPGAWFERGEGKKAQRVKVLMSGPAAAPGAQPGEVLSADEDLIVACGSGAVALKRLQKAGGKPQRASDFLRGNQLRPATH